MAALRLILSLTRQAAALGLTAGVSVVVVALGLFMPRSMWLLACRPWSVVVLRLLGVRLRVVGQQNLVGPALFAANHETFLDAIVLSALLPRRHKWLAKSGFLGTPLLRLARLCGGALIVRRTVGAAMSEVLGRLPADWSLALFVGDSQPPAAEPSPLRLGAVRLAINSRLPVVPIGVYGAGALRSAKAFGIEPGPVEITIGAPLSSDSWSEERATEHASVLHQALGRCVSASRGRHEGCSGASTPAMAGAPAPPASSVEAANDPAGSSAAGS